MDLCEIQTFEPIVTFSWLINHTFSPIQQSSPISRFHGKWIRTPPLILTLVPTVAPKILRILGRNEFGVKAFTNMRLEINHQKEIPIKSKSLVPLKLASVRLKKLSFTMEIYLIQSVRLSVKILSVSGPLHREFGGPPMAATGIAAAMTTLGHQVKIIVCGQSVQDTQKNSIFFDKLEQSPVEYEVLRRRNESKYGAFIRFGELKSIWSDVRTSDFVILHQVFQLQYIAIFPLIIFFKKPFAVMPHGTLTTYQRKQHRFRKSLFAPAIYSFLRSSNAIFVATEQEKIQLPRFLQRKGSVVGLGIDTRVRQTRNALNFSPTFNLLFMSRIAKKKRLDIALQAFALASEKSQVRMKFIVCGSGEDHYMAQLHELVKTLNIDSEVEFRGWVDSDEKHLAFLESDCFVLTSEDENFSIAAAEALAHGVPCILSSNVALSSLVNKHSAGIVFQELVPLEIEKAINKIVNTDKEALMKSSIRAAAELNWDLVAANWEATIERLLLD